MTYARSARPAFSPAFSLVELLAVVGILAVLIALLIPAVGRARTAAVRTACLSNLHGISIALTAYAADARGELPVVYTYPGVTDVALPGALFTTICRPSWAGVALLFRWPAEVLQPPGIVGRAYLSTARPLVCPGQSWDDCFQLPAGLYVSNQYRGKRWIRQHILGGGSYLYTYVCGPAALAANPDAAEYAGFERHALTTPDAARRVIVAEQTLTLGPGLTKTASVLPWNHGPGGNALYVDGHAAWVDATAVRPFYDRFAADRRDEALLTALDR